MLMAVASFRELPGAIVPGGVTLPPRPWARTRARCRRSARASRTAWCRCRRRPTSAAGRAPRPAAAASSSARRRRAQVVAEALGLTVPHAALAPSGQPIWLDVARRTADAVHEQWPTGARSVPCSRRPRSRTRCSSTPPSAARRTCCCTSRRSRTPPGCRGPTVDDWRRVNASVPRLVDALPNGPANHVTVRVFLAGGVPEVMLHLRRLGVLHVRGADVDGRTWDSCSTSGRPSERRHALRARLRDRTASIPTTSSARRTARARRA